MASLAHRTATIKLSFLYKNVLFFLNVCNNWNFTPENSHPTRHACWSTGSPKINSRELAFAPTSLLILEITCALRQVHFSVFLPLVLCSWARKSRAKRTAPSLQRFYVRVCTFSPPFCASAYTCIGTHSVYGRTSAPPKSRWVMRRNATAGHHERIVNFVWMKMDLKE